MRRHAEGRGSVRRGWASAALGLMLALVEPAMAGDRALLDIIGYSADGRYLAFEEFGFQDGSGFAYSNLYAVDLSEDSWVVGTPLRLRASDETTGLHAIRAQMQSEGAALLSDLDISLPADIIATIGDGVPDTDAAALRFGLPGFAAGEVRGDFELRLSTFKAEAASPCLDWFGVDPLGYQLTLVVDGAEPQVVHRDAALPRSRGCPQAYRIHAVAVPFNSDEGEGAVAILSVYPFGFEGPDRRFIAVPLVL